MPKEYKHNRISSINSNQISIWDIVRRLPKKDPEKGPMGPDMGII